MILAALTEHGDEKSLRQDRLSQDARDLIAWIFREKISANDIVPMPTNAVEIRIGDDELSQLFTYGAIRHGGLTSLRYFEHLEDEEWAVVMIGDCDGDPDNGWRLYNRARKGREARGA